MSILNSSITRSAIIAGFLCISQPTMASVGIEIDHDETDCLDGWLSMDVTATIGGHKFELDPSCSFSFWKTLVVPTSGSNSVQCRVDAGMCSVFSPQNRLEISCDDGASEHIDISCPAN